MIRLNAFKNLKLFLYIRLQFKCKNNVTDKYTPNVTISLIQTIQIT